MILWALRRGDFFLRFKSFHSGFTKVQLNEISTLQLGWYNILLISESSPQFPRPFYAPQTISVYPNLFISPMDRKVNSDEKYRDETPVIQNEMKATKQTNRGY